MTEQAKSRARRKDKEREFGEWPRTFAIDGPEIADAWELPADHIRAGANDPLERIVARKGETWAFDRVNEFFRAFLEHHTHGHSQADAVAPDQSTEIKVLREKLEALQSRVSRIEVVLEGVDEPPYVDPDVAWCEENLEKLRAHPDSFVAIDTEKGEVVVSATDQNKFISKMRQLEPGVRRTLLTTHTSVYLKPSGN